MMCAGFMPISRIKLEAGRWAKPRRVIAKVEWHPDELIREVADEPQGKVDQDRREGRQPTDTPSALPDNAVHRGVPR